MAGRDLSAEIFGPADGGGQGRDLSDEIFGPAAKPVTEADKERTVGAAIKDVGAGLVGGLGSIVQVPGQVYGLATGNFSKTGLLGAGERLSKFGEEMKSAGLKAREAERAKVVEEASKEGQFAAFTASLGQTITDPGLLASFLAEQAPQVIPMILAGGGAGYIAKQGVMSAAAARGAALEAAQRLAQKKAIQAGTTAAIQTGAVMQGADIGAGSYDEIVAGLIEQGVTPEQAAEEAINKARLAGVSGYGLSVLANRYLPGGKALEEVLAGKKLTGSRLGSAAITALKEIPSENIEEVGGKITQNIAAQQAGLDRELLGGTGEAAAMATLGAAGIGGAAGALSARPQVKPSEALTQVQEERDQFAKEFGEGTPVDVPAPVAAVELPGGFTVTQRELSREEVPESFGIFAEGSDKPLTTVATQADIDAKIASLTEIRAEEQLRLLEEGDKITKTIQAEGRKLDVMEATGKADTDEYVQAKALFSQKQQEAEVRLAEIDAQFNSYQAPLSFAPIGLKTDIQSDFVATRGGEIVGTYPTFEEAEATLRAAEPEVFKQADLEAETLRVQAESARLDELLRPLIAKFNLGDVGLNIVDRIANNAGGSYSGLNKLIEISMTGEKPLLTMRHEALHALKDLGFFTPQQWKALTERANKDWLVQLKKTPYEEGTSRYDAYLDMFTKEGQAKGLQGPELEQYANEALIEEAIADAFGAYESGAKPPPGLIAALFKKLKDFFKNFGQALRGAGFESSEDIFERVERGELKSRKPKKAVEEKPEQTMGERLSLLRKANPDEIDISTQNPQGVNRIYDPITEMLSIDAEAVREAMQANPKINKKIIQAIKSYGFIPDNTPDNKVLEVFKENIVNNLMFLYNKVPASTRKRSKLWYVGANKIAREMGENYGMSLRQISAIMAAMSPQKDWFQNVSMAERAIDILQKQGDQAWTPDMLRYAESYVKETKDRKEREKRGDAFEKIKKVANAGTVLNDMDEKSAAAFVRAYDEAFHSRDYRIVTPEGGFGDLVRNNNGKPSTMMWSTYGPIEKAVSIYRDGSRENVSQQLGFEHKIRSFYNNIANPDSEIDHVTIDTHAVAAALFEALAGTDTEVKQNFGATGSSDVLGVGGTYGLIADAYREAAKRAGVRAREMQSITWEAVRALFSEEVKSTIKPKIRAEWAKYKTGQQSFDETRQNVLEIAGQPDKLDDPDWIDSGVGQFVADGGTSYDKTFTPVGGVRLREEREIREKFTFNLSAVTNSIPGLRELYSSAMKGDDRAYELLQKVAESSLQYLLKGTGAKIKIEYSKGVYQADREPSISVSASFEERDQKAVMSALAKFAENYNQQQIHVRVPTIRKLGYEFGDGSYATPVYEIALPKKLNNAQISDIINQTDLQGFSVSERQVATKDGKVTENFLTAYWVAPNEIDQELESFDKFEQAARAAQAMAGVEGSKPRRTVERLYVYGSGPGATIGYEDIQSDLLPREGTDTVTPRLIAEYLRGEPVKVFKQKDLTNNQVEGQKLLAKVFDELPTKDLKNPLVRQAYNALNKELVKQYNAMPIKVKLVNGQRDEDGNFIDIYRNSAEMRKDVSNNNRFKVYKTEPGTFGPEGFNFKDHPLLKDSGLKDIDGKDMLFNDVLRAVHDYYAHNLADNEFGPKGESAAWRNHMSVTTDPLARWALTAETRAQNAWQNFREGAEDIPLKDRPFADQKAMLPPIGFTFTGEANVDQVMADYVATLTPEQQLGSLPSTSQYADDVRKQIPKPDKSKKYSLSEVKGIFDRAEKIQEPPGVEAIREQWIGGVSGIGDRDSMYDLYRVDGSKKYVQDVQNFIRNELGNDFKGYRLMSNEELEEIQTGAMGSQFASFTLNPDVARAFKNIPAYAKKTGMSVIEMDLTPEHVAMIGHPGELELVVDYGQGYNPSDVKVVEKYSLSTALPKKMQELGITPEMVELYKDMFKKDRIVQADTEFATRSEKIQATRATTKFFDAIAPLNNDAVVMNRIGMYVNEITPNDEDPRFKKYSLSAPTTPEFKQFFGESKAVDKDGKPKIMYHGTSKDVTDFTRKEMRGAPIFLTDDPTFADRFAMDSVDVATARVEQVLTEEQISEGRKLAIAAVRKDYRSRPEGKVMIDSINTNDYSKATPEAKEYLRKAYAEMMPSGPNVMPVYVSAQNPFDYENPSHIQQMVGELNKLTDSYGRKIGDLEKGYLAAGRWEQIETKAVQNAILKLGFDSFYVKEDGRKNLAVYESGQVKSAIGNTGAFDRENPDVRYSLKNVSFPSVKEVKDAVEETSIPKTDAFKRFIAGNQWNDSDGNPMVFYHATARSFFEFEPAGESKVVYLSTTPEAAQKYGVKAQDRLQQEVYRALTKDEKLSFFERVLDAQTEKGAITEAESASFMRQAKRKIPVYGKFGEIEDQVYAALLDLSPSKMAIMPLYARAETPFDFENKEHVAQVMEWVTHNTDYPQENAELWLRSLKGRIAQGVRQAIEDPRVQRGLRRFGFDSFTLKDDRTPAKTYAVYQPTQLKSVTGNLGEFGRETKNIRFSLPTIPTNIYDRVNETTTTRERKNFAQRMIAAITPVSAAEFRASAVNQYNQLSVYDKKRAETMGGAVLLADQSAESAALFSDVGAGIAASAMALGDRNGGIPVLRNGITTIDTSVKGLVPSLAPLARYNDPVVYQLYQYWAMVKRGQRLDKQGKPTGITTADVAYAKTLEAKFPEFVSVQKDLTAFNNGLVKYMVDTGVLSKERGVEYMKYADYVPFYRQMDGEKTIGPNLFQSLSGVKPPKKLKGAIAEEAPLADFLETMVRNTQSAIQAGIKNYAGQRAIDVALQVKAPGMGVTRLPTPSTSPEVINVLEKGELVSYETPDKLLLDAVKSLNLSELPFMGILSAPANLLRNLVTKEPGFMMANLLRDSLSAYVTSGVKMTPVVDTVMAFGKSLTRNSPAFEALLNAGIISGYDSGNIEKSGLNLEKDLAKKAGQKDALLLRPFTSLWDALEKGTTASDAATRVVIYERVLAETGNEAEALFRSLEVMNFHRKGNSVLIRVLTAAIPFFNARLQGLDLFYRASTGNMNNKDAAAIQRQFFVRGMTMMALSGMYYFMVSDDEEYKKQEQETKDNNWLIPYLGIRIPIPFEVGVLFKTIPERIAAYIFGNDTGQDLRDALIRNAVSTFAFNPTPQLIKPLVEVAFDFNMFTLRPIISEGMKDVDSQYQVSPGTSSAAKLVAGALGLSPIKVDHIIKGYTGTMGMYAIDTLDMVMDQFSDSPKATKRFEQLPFIKRFALDPEARGNVTEHYKLKDSVDTVVRTLNFLEKQGESEQYVDYLKKNQGTFAFKDYVRDTEKAMKELRQMKSAVQISKMSGDEKRDAITGINRAENAINSEIQRIKTIIASSQ